MAGSPYSRREAHRDVTIARTDRRHGSPLLDPGRLNDFLQSFPRVAIPLADPVSPMVFESLEEGLSRLLPEPVRRIGLGHPLGRDPGGTLQP